MWIYFENPAGNWFFHSPIALDETIVPPDVPSYLSSQGTLSERQDVAIGVDTQQPNGHIDSNGEKWFNYPLMLHLNLIWEVEIPAWSASVFVFVLSYLRDLYNVTPAFMQSRDLCLTSQSSPLPGVSVPTSLRKCSWLPQKLLSQALRTVFLLILDSFFGSRVTHSHTRKCINIACPCLQALKLNVGVLHYLNTAH